MSAKRLPRARRFAFASLCFFRIDIIIKMGRGNALTKDLELEFNAPGPSKTAKHTQIAQNPNKAQNTKLLIVISRKTNRLRFLFLEVDILFGICNLHDLGF